MPDNTRHGRCRQYAGALDSTHPSRRCLGKLKDGATGVSSASLRPHPLLQRRCLYRCTDTSVLEGARAQRPTVPRLAPKRGPRMSGAFDRASTYSIRRGTGTRSCHAMVLRAPLNRAENVWCMTTSTGIDGRGAEETWAFLCRQMQGGGAPARPWSSNLVRAAVKVQGAGERRPSWEACGRGRDAPSPPLAGAGPCDGASSVVRDVGAGPAGTLGLVSG